MDFGRPKRACGCPKIRSRALTRHDSLPTDEPETQSPPIQGRFTWSSTQPSFRPPQGSTLRITRRRCSVMAPSSQGSEPAQYPVRFSSRQRRERQLWPASDCSRSGRRWWWPPTSQPSAAANASRPDPSPAAHTCVLNHHAPAPLPGVSRGRGAGAWRERCGASPGWLFLRRLLRWCCLFRSGRRWRARIGLGWLGCRSLRT